MTKIHSIQTGMSCAYLIESSGGLMLVDAGGPGAERIILRNIRELGHAELRLIYLTHAHLDHYGGVAALHRATEAPVAIHRADAQALEHGLTQTGSARGFGKVMGAAVPWVTRLLEPEGLTADVLLEDGAELSAYGFEAVIVHTPGHTPGSSSLILGDHTAFVGDLIITRGARAHAQRYFAQDWDEVGKSLRRIQELRPRWVFGGHGCRGISGDELMRL
jgi:glyoxylase-like metal-dependent hydrolase (beta-lactamase superfamily II)